MTETFFAFDERDAPDARGMLQEFRKRRQGDDIPTAPPVGVRAVLVVKPPKDFDPGRCMPLLRDAEYPYIWEVSLIGYPGFEELETIEAEIEGELFEFKWNALPAEARESIPENWRKKAAVSGGTVHDDKDESFTDTGRFYFGFSEEPESFEVTPTNSEIVVVESRKVVFRPSPVLRDFWTIADVTVPSPIAAGAVGFAADVIGLGLSILSVEPRSFRPIGVTS